MSQRKATLPLTESREKRNGYIFSIASYGLWGLLPIYWHSMAKIAPLEVLSHRVLWSAILMIGVMTVLRQWRSITTLLKSRKTSLTVTACALLISTNWLVFIWAISVDRTLETSLGYFINPLLNVLVGAFILRERLSRLQIAAVALAALGVLYAIFAAGHLPWIALVLAGSFTAYGYLRKIMAADSLTGLTAETCLLLPLAIAGVIWFWIFEGMAFGTHIGAEPSLFNIVLLVGSGPITAAPLLLFAAGARRLPLSTMGFLQYLAPSLMFIISVALFHEALTPEALITFLCIWSGIALYILDNIRKQRTTKAPI